MVIPVGDVNTTSRTPYVTWLLLLTNVAVFVALQPWAAGACAQQRFFLQWATIPAEVVGGAPLPPDTVAAIDPGCGLMAQPQKNVFVSIVTALFLHAGWLHLLGNMLYLWVFGDNVEDRMGHLGFLVFYLGAGIIATALFVLADPASPAPLAGASGAIAGVLGAYLVLYPRNRVTVLVPFLLFLPLRLPALIVLGLWFVVQLFPGEVASMSGANVAYLAHVAGFVTGMLAVWVFGLRRRGATRPAYD